MRRIKPALVPLVLLAAGAVHAAGPSLAEASIGELRARVHDRELLVSFQLRDAFPEDLVERLHSGIAVTFRHKVEMILRRPFFLVPNRLLERTVVETRVEYDSLTRQYRLQRRTENKTQRPDDPFLDLEVRRSTESLDEAREWLTVVRDVPLLLRQGVGDPERMRVRVQSNLGRRFVMLMFPSSYSVSAELRVKF